MHNLSQDLRYGLRVLAKSPGFALVSILTLAIGIGANTAMFSVINAVLLRPLPFRDPQQLVTIGEFETGPRERAGALGTLSYPNLMDVRARNHSFSEVAGYSNSDATLTGAGEALHVTVETVSSNMFALLGVRPRLGRPFADGEDKPGHHVAVVSEAFWKRQFHGDPGVVGNTVALNGRAYTIVGVMSPGFQFPVQAEPAQLWVTFSRDSEVDDPKETPVTEQRGAHYVNAIARLKTGMGVEAANADLGAIAHRLAAEFPNSNANSGIAAEPELENLVGDSRRPLLVLFGAVGLVLLIACSNVANLLLARASNRAHEIAIRAALGASPWRVTRQLLVEALAVAFAAAAAGTTLASWGLVAMLKLYPSNLPRSAEIGIDFRVLLFTVALAVATGILFGIVPAWRSSNPNLTESMREGGRGSTASAAHHRIHAVLVIAETALGVILLVSAGLLIRSFARLSHVNLGLNPGHVLTANFDLSETRYNPDQQDRFIGTLMNRLNALPGVIRAAGALPLPLGNGNLSLSFNLLDHPVPEADEPTAKVFVVTSGFFETLQVPLVRGRTFDERDQRNSAPVIIVNQEFAKTFFPNEDPIGRQIKIGGGDGPARARYKTREIIGIVGDFRRRDIGRVPVPAYFVPLPQLMWGSPTLIIRTAGQPNSITAEVRKVLAGMDADAPLYDVRTLDDYFALDVGRARFQAVLLGLFAGIALLLTAIGLYAVMAYSVAQRRQEIGVRMALGASSQQVLGMVLGRSVLLVATGLVVGVGGAVAITRMLTSLLYEVKGSDPATFVAVSALLVGSSLLASYIPARRAAKVDPMVALRYE